MIALTGKRLISGLIAKQGFIRMRENATGVLLVNRNNGKTRRAIIKDTDKPIPGSVLQRIAGPSQTGLGIDEHRRLAN